MLGRRALNRGRLQRQLYRDPLGSHDGFGAG
jgi:hypothetical protein